LFWVTAAPTIGSLVCFVVLYKSNQPAAYFLLPSRLWELGAGCLLSLVMNNPKSAMRPVAEISPTMVIVALSGVLFVPQFSLFQQPLLSFC
jgi:peptidoglycan/LPS O-acetylase OafA/YrhL